ncbi:MAG: single-stranded DNA-binding protein [Planctomycetota bacterium]
MASFNRVILVGNLTRDIELRYTPQGTAVTDIGLAVNERVKKNDEWVDEVNFFDVTLWGRTAEVAGEYLSKGSSILIEGRLKLDRWEQQDGAKRSKIKIIGERMQMLGGRQGGQGGGSSRGPYQAGGQPQAENAPAPQSAPSPAQGPPDDDIPF